MKAQHLSMNMMNQQKKQQLNLFSKLKDRKTNINHNNTNTNNNIQLEKIKGIQLIQSENQDNQDNKSSINIQDIKRRLQEYKCNKAKQVLELHRKTNKSIQNIVSQYKQIYKRQALAIINPNLINSHQRNEKCIKELGSTLPNSSQRQVQIQTPGFDLTTVQKHHEFTIDLRQFTLGQKQEQSSQVSLKQTNQHESVVSEFQVNARQPSSRRIKDRIMNSSKNRGK